LVAPDFKTSGLLDRAIVMITFEADTLALIAAIDNPHLRLMLDIYHAQIGEGRSS
jgi:hydroxypyruvate isomerase